MQKVSNSLPYVGAVTLPFHGKILLTIKMIITGNIALLAQIFPSLTAVFQTAVLAFVGAAIGFFAKMLFEFIVKKVKSWKKRTTKAFR